MTTNLQTVKLDVRTLAPVHDKEIKNGNAMALTKFEDCLRSWRSMAAACAVQHPSVRKMWAEPDWSSFKIRSKSYLADKIKQTTEETLFELVWFDLFSGDHADLLHVSQNPKSFAQRAIAKYGNEMPQLFVVTLLIPGTPLVACTQYFAAKKELLREQSEATELWQKFLTGDAAFRNNRLKLIPSIVDGPWIVKKSVGSKPVILGHALQMTYYQTPYYLEACVDISSEKVAKHITSLCRSQSSHLKVDMGFVIEGQAERELPERLLCCVEYDHIELQHATLIKGYRHAKRLGKLAGRAEHTAEEEEEEELEEKRPANVGFAFLADSDSDSDESDSDASDAEQEEAQEEEEDSGGEEEEEVIVPTAAVISANSKKNKNKTNKSGLPDSDDVDELLEALAAQAGDLSGDQATSARNTTENSLFSVQLNVINADKEMKRIFGVREVRENSSGARRVDPRNAARKTTKKVFTVTPHDDWPRLPTFVGGGIRWTRANKPQGPSWNSLCQYFEITWSLAYKKAQAEFEVLQQTHDPNLISHFLLRYPFHIDALLQMSEVFQHHGQMDHASDCIKRCMYVLELAWADQFDVTQGNCRMDMKTEHNDGFFKALFLLMKQVGRRGCMRSAFETAKLLLGLDPQGDPMHVMLAIDYYAVSARQYQFVVDLYDATLEAVDRESTAETTTTVGAMKQKNKKMTKNTDDNVSALPSVQLSLALAHHFLGNADQAKESLARALLRFPTVLKPLLEKIAVNTSSSTWQSVLGSRVFANAKSVDENGPLQHVLDIYVKRNHTLWKVNEVQAFLLKGAQYAISSGLAAMYPQVTELPPSLAKYKRSYPGDYSDDITTLPADHPMLQPAQHHQQQGGQPQFNLDDLNEEQLAQLELLQQQAAEGNLPADANPLLLFLQTLLPWNRVQGAAPPGAPQE